MLNFELWPIPQQELDRNPKLVQIKGIKYETTRFFLTYSLLTGGSSLFASSCDSLPKKGIKIFLFHAD